MMTITDDLTTGMLQARQIGMDPEEHEFQRDLRIAEQSDLASQAAPQQAQAPTEEPKSPDDATSQDQPDSPGFVFEMLNESPAVKFITGAVESSAERGDEPETGGIEGLIGAVEDTVQAIPRNAVLGVTRAIDETFNLALGRETVDGVTNWMNDNIPGYQEADSALRDALKEGATTELDEATADFFQFAAPFMGYMKAATAMGMSNVGAGITADSLASFINMDPHEERLASFAKEAGLQSEFIDFMSGYGGDGGQEFIDRSKNAIENTGLGVVAISVLPILQGTALLRQAIKYKAAQ